MIKKALALTLAAALALGLCGCGDKEEKTPGVTESNIPDVSQPFTEDSSEPLLPAKKSTFDSIKEIASASGTPYGVVPEKDFGENDSYSRTGETVLAFEGGALITVLSFSDEKSAEAYASYYDEEGDCFSSPQETIMLGLAMPQRMWRCGQEIISYSATDGALYPPLKELLGEPFASCGDYNLNNPRPIGEDENAGELIEASLAAFYVEYDLESYPIDPDGEDGLGALTEDYYTFDNGDSLSIVSFESTQKAAEYFACFKDNGDTWDNGTVKLDMEYESPAHLWLINSKVITYCSESGEHLDIINSAIGFESFGAGYDYYLPEYAKDLAQELRARRISFRSKKVVLVPNPIYMYSPKSVCAFAVGMNLVYVSDYGDEAAAIDHASRFSPDAQFYTGLAGQSRITIGFGRQYPVRLFRKGSVIAEYSCADESLLPALEKVYGAQFAGNNGLEGGIAAPVSAQPRDMEHQAEFIRTDGYTDGVTYPQYTVIRSKDELDEYYLAHREIYDLERHEKVYSDTTIGFLDKADNYTEEWFDTNSLVLVLLEEGSGSIRHEVRGVVKQPDGSYKLSIARLCPEIGTDDMAEWHLFLEMTGEKLNPLAKFEVDITGEDV